MTSHLFDLSCICLAHSPIVALFFFNDTAPTEIYTLSLHDALPISLGEARAGDRFRRRQGGLELERRRHAHLPRHGARDRKSTRLNSSHDQISYAVFCLKKKKKNTYKNTIQSLYLLNQS